MNKEYFLQSMDELLELDPGTVKEDVDLTSLSNWDSLAVLGFIALVDQNFGLILSPDAISNSKTVSDLLSLIGNKLSVD